MTFDQLSMTYTSCLAFHGQISHPMRSRIAAVFALLLHSPGVPRGSRWNGTPGFPLTTPDPHQGRQNHT